MKPLASGNALLNDAGEHRLGFFIFNLVTTYYTAFLKPHAAPCGYR
jgi:hypothetical protein